MMKLFVSLLILWIFPLFSEEIIPNFPLTRLDNGKVFAMHKELSSLEDGNFLVLNFTQSTCKPCKKEIPELMSLSRSNPKLKLALVFIGDIDREVEKTLKDLGVSNALVLLDRLEGSFTKLNFRGVPHTFVIGKDKVIKAKLEGYSDTNMEQLRSLLKP